jgi:hypothetical protein
MKEYYAVVNNKQKGPFSLKELAELHITHDTLVWKEGFQDWCRAGEVQELASLFSGSPASQYEEDDEEYEEDDEDEAYYPYRKRINRFDKVMDSNFFTFIRPYLKFIDKGQLYRKPFSWLYKLIAALNLLFPLYVLYVGIEFDILNAPSKVIVVSFLSWLVLVLTGWIGFQLWWDRSGKVLETSDENDEFPATPVIAHFIQTFGEWFGTSLTVVGFFVSLFITIFLSEYDNDIFDDFIPYFGAVTIIVMPVIGFLIIIFFRLMAEQIRALVTIANNTKKTKTPS